MPQYGQGEDRPDLDSSANAVRFGPFSSSLYVSLHFWIEKLDIYTPASYRPTPKPTGGDCLPKRILVAGEALIDFIPDRPGSLSEVNRFTRRIGGAPANVAVGLARLDRAPWFWTRIGADAFGDAIARKLNAEGLSPRFIERDREANTSLAFVEKDRFGNQRFSFHRDATADTRLRAGAVPDEVLSDVDWIYVGGVALTTEPSRSAIQALAERSSEFEYRVFFDPNTRQELWTDELVPAFETVLSHTDAVKATTTDLSTAGIDGDDPEDLATSVHHLGPTTVFITLGAGGVFASATRDSPFGAVEISHEGYDVDSTDTTGAGDGFVAGALASLYEGENLSTVVSFANAVAALSTRETGAMEALPHREAVESLRGKR